MIRYSETTKHDHIFLQEVQSLPSGSIITFAKGYVDYSQYETFTPKSIGQVTRLKDNARYKARNKFNIPDDADSGVLKDEEAVLLYGPKKYEGHKCQKDSPLGQRK